MLVLFLHYFHEATMATTEQNQLYFHEASFVDENGQPQTHKIPVVQELARQGIQHLPQSFVWPPHEGPSPSLVLVPYVDEAFPTINMTNLALEEPIHRSQELARFAEEWGLFLLENHGIASEVVRSVKDVVAEFGVDRRLTVRDAPARDTEGLDVCPRKSANFREVMENYVKEARRVMDHLVEALYSRSLRPRKIELSKILRTG